MGWLHKLATSVHVQWHESTNLCAHTHCVSRPSPRGVGKGKPTSLGALARLYTYTLFTMLACTLSSLCYHAMSCIVGSSCPTAIECNCASYQLRKFAWDDCYASSRDNGAQQLLRLLKAPLEGVVVALHHQRVLRLPASREGGAAGTYIRIVCTAPF